MAEKEKKKLNVRTVEWFKAVKSEFKKIVWPAPKKIARDTGVVIVLVIVMAAFIYAVQWLFHAGVQFLLPN